MILTVVFALLSITALADEWPGRSYYSISPHVGSGQGISYSVTGSGRITGVRVWEANNNYIYGSLGGVVSANFILHHYESPTLKTFQLRYGYQWTDVTGRESGQMQEIELFDNEAIVQISGKYAHYIQSLVFTTNLGRSLYAGRPTGHSFNMYPNNEKGELRFISGRFRGAITSIGAHWGVVSEPYQAPRKYY